MILFSFSIISLITFTTITIATPLTPPLSPRQATNGPHSPTIIWSCTANRQPSLNIPSVCANMCYGAYCRGYSTTLTWDNFANKSYAERKYNAGCVGPTWDYTIQEGGVGGSWDRCKEVGRECSVYPFLSTREGDVDAPGGDWGPVSRCVDAGENAREFLLPPIFILLTSSPSTSSIFLPLLNTTTNPTTSQIHSSENKQTKQAKA